MERRSFEEKHILLLSQAIDISEELISNYYKISTSDWKRYRYDIRTLKDLLEDEITDFAFAQIRRYIRDPRVKELASKHGDFFKICLQDHVILRALERDPEIQFLPLVTYIVTHELIHVVRFAKFLQRFETDPAESQREERRVHSITYELLVNQRIPHMNHVLEAFKDQRIMETFATSPSKLYEDRTPKRL